MRQLWLVKGDADAAEKVWGLPEPRSWMAAVPAVGYIR